ncbi:MAG TPA: ribonuclease HIII [Negativicutes bacterium]|nr:ribonuclease HIII [Negativicutes bacterium]
MYKAKDKYDYYEHLKKVLESNGIEAGEYNEINYGLQFNIMLDNKKLLIRVYESKKTGVRHDLSQVKDGELFDLLEDMILGTGTEKKQIGSREIADSENPEKPLIGTDESGKGDYFGPLIVAGVYAAPEDRKWLKRIGAADSKTLTDSKIEKLAEEITARCKYSIITFENKSYNETYRQIGNLNRLLARGHAQVIENLLEVVECSNVLADQFGSPELIRDALMARGKLVKLEQRHRAEENVVVAAASILARNEYVKEMKRLSEKYEFDFPKGCSSLVTETAREFVRLYGREKLDEVAKLHFVVTEKL